MKQFLDVYDVTLTTLGPLYIGNGQEYKKTEYIYDKPNKKIIIPDCSRMYSDLKRLGKASAYESYILTPKEGLSTWLFNQRITNTTYDSWTRYSLYCGDAILEKGDKTNIMTCVKDIYGCPYVPGSSLKGMLRTILLSYDINKNDEKYSYVKQEIRNNLPKSNNKKKCLSREDKLIEQIAFNKNTLTENRKDAVNDILSGLRISDSMPLDVDCLTLCQKVEMHKDGECKKLGILRECIVPNTEIHFKLTIDRSLCKISIDYIREAISYFANQMYDNFICKFSGADRPADNNVWFGGGVGFVSKTTIYPMFNKEGVGITSQIFKKTKVPDKHKHINDVRENLSPHILKVTQYMGKRYQFGLCKIDFKPNGIK